MSLSQQFEVGFVDETQRWALAPSAARTDLVDDELRVRLIDSLSYLAEVATLDAGRGAAFADVEARLASGPISPWVFALYAKLVASLSAEPSGGVGSDFDAIVAAAHLPADHGVVALRDPAVPAAWWDHFQLLFDTDRKRPFHPRTPAPDSFARCQQEIEQGLSLMRRADPIWYEEIGKLLRFIVLGAPASAESVDLFNGASTFFLWGATLLNADISRTPISIADLLVHESSHGLLFGFSAAGALTHNRGDERHNSPLRKDARPVDGIFHACFVATRVHLAMTRLLDSGLLTASEKKQAVQRRDFNGDAARTALEILAQHARPTMLGCEILGTIRAYWAASPAK